MCETPEDTREPCLGSCRNEQENKTKGPKPQTSILWTAYVFVLSYFPSLPWLDEEIALQTAERWLAFIGCIPLDARH